MPDFEWIDELVESVTGHLRQAEGVALDESVARAYRRDVPKLLAAISALSALRDTNPDEWEYDAGWLSKVDGTYDNHGEVSEYRNFAVVVADSLINAGWVENADFGPVVVVRRRRAGPWGPAPVGGR